MPNIYIDYDKMDELLEDITNYLKDYDKYVTESINDLNTTITQSTTWKGEDKTVFCENLPNYTTYFETVTSDLTSYKEKIEECIDQYKDAEDYICTLDI